jgi:hypothetical protein
MKNQFVQKLVELQKKGINIWLSEDGYREFLSLMEEDAEEFFEKENIAL